ncbi:hypothetical protein Cpir12675_006598 [Ceratocystis pirilliformis]|uniref:Uncharacterized protein n=1 Tax=Ceratocystis pirilliformis TaxID=259994 RepID=A0ABR3YH80_9PEZI
MADPQLHPRHQPKQQQQQQQPPQPQQRSGSSRRRPFSTWVRKLANFNKNLSLSSSPSPASANSNNNSSASCNDPQQTDAINASSSLGSARYRLSTSHQDRLRQRNRSDSESAAPTTTNQSAKHARNSSITAAAAPTSTSKSRPKLTYHMKMKKPSKNNNPYPQSARLVELMRHRPRNTGPHSSLPSFFSAAPSTARSNTSLESSFIEVYSSNGGILLPAQSHGVSTISGDRNGSGSGSVDTASVNASIISSNGSLRHPPTISGSRSIAATVMTDHETARSALTATTNLTIGAATDRSSAMRGSGGNSTFSSPAPSVRSLATTLTTIQSLAISAANPAPNSHHHGMHHMNAGATSHTTITFNQPFPTAPPASALPPYLAPSTPGHPTTYATATANNLLTDNASILTLASSSKHRRRRSFDTDASVRALAPSSLWGGSRESLPLSILSANLESGPPGGGPGGSGSGSGAGSFGAMGPSVSVPPTTSHSNALSLSDRNSIYTSINPSTVTSNVTGARGDGSSLRSMRSGGLHLQNIADSVGSSGPTVSSPLASPMEDASLETQSLREATFGTKDTDEDTKKALAKGKEPIALSHIVYN